MSIKDPETEELAAEVAALAGETKAGAIKRALVERRSRLVAAREKDNRKDRLQRLLEDELWPQIPPAVLGSSMTKAERENILGYGAEGV